MDARGVIEALGLPAGALVEQRVPKKLLLENGGPTGADKKHISGGIEELFWVAALKPNTIGVPEFSDAEREYLEIAVLRLTVRPEAKAARLIELVHRAIPYPLLLAVEQGTRVTVTAAHKRRAHNEADRTVLDGEVISADWAAGDGAPPPGEFREALALERQPRGSLLVLYRGWVDTLSAFRAARITGSFRQAAGPEEARARERALAECARLEAEMGRLRAAAKREKQMPRLVELNMKLKRLEAAHAASRAML